MSGVVLIAGDGGFIGAWVVRVLSARGARPIVLDAHAGGERRKLLLGDQTGSIDRVLLTGVRET